MENLSINTTQNVNLLYSPAGVGQRLLSVILDIIIKTSYVVVLYLIAIRVFIKDWINNRYEGNTDFNQVMLGLLILLTLPAVFYHLLCETFLNGQSLGKKIIKIKVVKLNGTQPNFGTYLIRSMFRIIDDGLIGIIAIAASQKSQRLGDMVAGTTVIQIDKKVSLKETILNQEWEGYKIVYEQVALLSDSDANTIKEVLDFARVQNKPEYLKLLAQKIKAKYSIATDNQSDEGFLETLLLDYTHYQFEK